MLILYLVWGAGIAAKGYAALRMAVQGHSRTLFPVWLYLFTSFLYSLACIASRPDHAIYTAVYSAGIPFVLLAKCMATVSIFWALGVYYPRFRTPGTIILGFLTAVAVTVSWASTFLAPSISSLWSASIAVPRYAGIVIFVVAGSSRLAVNLARFIPVPAHAKRAAVVMVIDALLEVSSSWFTQAYAYQYPKTVALVVAVSIALTGAAWLTLMAPEPIVPIDLAEGTDEVLRQSASNLRMTAAILDDIARSPDRG
jgi:hypothetical protein